MAFAPLVLASLTFATRHAAPVAIGGRPALASAALALYRLRGGSAVVEASWLSVLPPIVALGASVALKQVIVALILGVWTGGMVIHRGKPALSLLRVFDRYMVRALADAEHAGVLLFTLLLGGTIGIVQRAGGGLGLARLLSVYMTSAMRGLCSAWALCCMIFFDDYSSVLIVGSSLRPVLQTVGVAPERLAMIVHTMGVVLASMSPISSWIGLQLGYVAGVYKQIGSSADPFLQTMGTLPYRFFPCLMFIMIPLLLVMRKDLGPMATYPLPLASIKPSTSVGRLNQALEAADAPSDGLLGAGQAREGLSYKGAPKTAPMPDDALGSGPLSPKAGVPHRAINALLPFGTIAVATFGGMLLDGAVKLRAKAGGAAGAAPLTLVAILGESDSIAALIWASTVGWLVSMALVLTQGVLTLTEAMDAWIEGMKDVLAPTIVLLLAWGLGDVLKEAKAAEFIAGALQSSLPKWALPALISVLAHIISYACGSSFGTMGIILPLVGPLATQLGGDDPAFLRHCIASVLGGATFGNLCSPISDTSILTVLSTKYDLPRVSDHECLPLRVPTDCLRVPLIASRWPRVASDDLWWLLVASDGL